MALPVVHFAYSGFCTCAKFNSYRRHGHQLTSLHVQAPDEASLQIWMDALRSYKEGYLTKQGAVVKNWKRRWFVLYKTQLAYFDGPSGGARRERKGYILLKEVLPGSVHPVDDASVGRQNTFQIEIKEQTFFLTGDTVDQMDDWLDSILRSIQTRGRLQSVAEALEADSLDPSQGGEVSRDSAVMTPLEGNHQAALEAKMKEAQEIDEEEAAGYQAGGAAEGETNTGQLGGGGMSAEEIAAAAGLQTQLGKEHYGQQPAKLDPGNMDALMQVPCDARRVSRLTGRPPA